jgi:hypothetical protein
MIMFIHLSHVHVRNKPPVRDRHRHARLSLPISLSRLTRRVFGVLCERVCRVRAETLLGVLGRLLCVTLEAVGAALVVDVARGLTGLGLALLLRLWRLAAGVRSGHGGCVVGLESMLDQR